MSEPSPSEGHRIFVLSDATGETAQRVVTSALRQFNHPDVDVVTFARVRTESRLRQVFERAAQERVMVVHTLVDPQQREQVSRLAEELHVETVDAIGQMLAKLGDMLGVEPTGRPGILSPLDDEYFRRIAAVEFAVNQDDGQLPRGLHKADIVLVGPSRTSKTPLSTILAHRGLKVANIPIVLDIPLPRELFEIPQHRVYGLTIDLSNLVRIRRGRLKQLGMPLDTQYARQDYVVRELKNARQLFEDNPIWPVVDVSRKAIEETASIISSIARDRDKDRERGELIVGEPDRYSGLYLD